MLIDWFTVSAQIINFVILVLLLKRYLYHPILAAIDTREKLIAGQLQEALAAKAAAQKEQEEFKKKNDDIDQQRSILLRQASDEAAKEKQKLIAAAHSEIAALRAKEKIAQQRDDEALWHDITQRTQDEVFAIARKTLSDLTSRSLEAPIVAKFCDRLLSLNEEEKKRISTSQTMQVRCAFPLEEAQQQQIIDALKASLQHDSTLHFSTAPQVIAGIELTCNGYKLAWSISDYLRALEKTIRGPQSEKRHDS